ncbi:MAG: hypothetical protein WKG06_26435 [Segetibacter sp.]
MPKPINTDFIVTQSRFMIKASMTGLIDSKIKAAKLYKINSERSGTSNPARNHRRLKLLSPSLL